MENIYCLNNFCVVQKGKHYFAVMECIFNEPFSEEITSGSSFSNAVKKAKLLQRGYDLAVSYIDERY